MLKSLMLGWMIGCVGSHVVADVDAEWIESATRAGVTHLLRMEEGADRGEWPYEGVYRVNGRIPIGYRVGGTGIVCEALLRAPGFAEDAERRSAVARGATFVIGQTSHALMTPDYESNYDVRGWGYTYGARLLLSMRELDAVPPDLEGDLDEAIRFYIDAIEATEMPETSGWNYSRPRGQDSVGPPSSFMTASTLQTLFLARHLGYDVDQGVLDGALDFLEKARVPSGEFVYSGTGERRAGGVPGAVGRMLVSEVTLHLAGRSEVHDVRGALDSFIVHWEWLEKRRQKSGTHVRPYQVAPYYFMFAHYHAAQAVECLPTRERAEYRRRINDLLSSVRDEDGTWNDRVFTRTANYSTAMAMMSIGMPEIGLPPRLEE